MYSSFHVVKQTALGAMRSIRALVEPSLICGAFFHHHQEEPSLKGCLGSPIRRPLGTLTGEDKQQIISLAKYDSSWGRTELCPYDAFVDIPLHANPYSI